MYGYTIYSVLGSSVENHTITTALTQRGAQRGDNGGDSAALLSTRNQRADSRSEFALVLQCYACRRALPSFPLLYAIEAAVYRNGNAINIAREIDVK